MTTVWVVAGMYDAYGDRWPVVAGVWQTEKQAEEHLRLLNSVPESYNQPRPGPGEGHADSFREYTLEVFEVVIDQPVERFDPWKSLDTLRARGWKEEVAPRSG